MVVGYILFALASISAELHCLDEYGSIWCFPEDDKHALPLEQTENADKHPLPTKEREDAEASPRTLCALVTQSLWIFALAAGVGVWFNCWSPSRKRRTVEEKSYEFNLDAHTSWNVIEEKAVEVEEARNKEEVRRQAEEEVRHKLEKALREKDAQLKEFEDEFRQVNMTTRSSEEVDTEEQKREKAQNIEAHARIFTDSGQTPIFSCVNALRSLCIQSWSRVANDAKKGRLFERAHGGHSVADAWEVQQQLRGIAKTFAVSNHALRFLCMRGWHGLIVSALEKSVRRKQTTQCIVRMSGVCSTALLIQCLQLWSRAVLDIKRNDEEDRRKAAEENMTKMSSKEVAARRNLVNIEEALRREEARRKAVENKLARMCEETYRRAELETQAGEEEARRNVVEQKLMRLSVEEKNVHMMAVELQEVHKKEEEEEARKKEDLRRKAAEAKLVRMNAIEVVAHRKALEVEEARKNEEVRWKQVVEDLGRMSAAEEDAHGKLVKEEDFVKVEEVKSKFQDGCVCGNTFLDDEIYCRKCGKKCSEAACVCGNFFLADSIYCRKCGTKRLEVQGSSGGRTLEKAGAVKDSVGPDAAGFWPDSVDARPVKEPSDADARKARDRLWNEFQRSREADHENAKHEAVHDLLVRVRHERERGGVQMPSPSIGSIASETGSVDSLAFQDTLPGFMRRPFRSPDIPDPGTHMSSRARHFLSPTRAASNSTTMFEPMASPQARSSNTASPAVKPSKSSDSLSLSHVASFTTTRISSASPAVRPSRSIDSSFSTASFIGSFSPQIKSIGSTPPEVRNDFHATTQWLHHLPSSQGDVQNWAGSLRCYPESGFKNLQDGNSCQLSWPRSSPSSEGYPVLDAEISEAPSIYDQS